jgi:predicted metalloprotease
MRWDDGRESGNVEDRRGGGLGQLGVGGVVILIIVGVVYALVTHKDPSEIIGDLSQVVGSTEQAQKGPPKDEEGKFAAIVLGSTEDVWSARFQAHGQTYQDPTLVLYDQATFGGCGLGAEAMGPFYCPIDRKVYLDLQFFQELEQKFGAKGDFARGYVIAHEVGHHVQNLMGLTDRIQRAEQDAAQTGGKPAVNKISVQTELQADCFAGIWAKDYVATGRADAQDIDSALSAAAAVGDDTIERRTRGEVVPDSFTHGTAEQRTHWFKVGYQTGNEKACDTFKAAGMTLPDAGAPGAGPENGDPGQE